MPHSLPRFHAERSTRYRKLATGSFAQQCTQRATQQLAEGLGDGPPVMSFADVELFKTGQQIKRFSINLDKVACRPASLPLPTAPDVVRAPLPKGGSFLNHG
jgi:hypothetical protein